MSVLVLILELLEAETTEQVWMILIAFFISTVFWGSVTSAVAIKKKRRSGLWFLWGFLFEQYGFAVAVAVNERREHQSRDLPARQPEDERFQLLVMGGWNCTCGRTNPSYVSTCSCGVNRRDLRK